MKKNLVIELVAASVFAAISVVSVPASAGDNSEAHMAMDRWQQEIAQEIVDNGNNSLKEMNNIITFDRGVDWGVGFLALQERVAEDRSVAVSGAESEAAMPEPGSPSAAKLAGGAVTAGVVQ